MGDCWSLPGPGSAPCFERLLRMSGSWVEAGSEPSEFVRTKATALNLDCPGLSGIFNFLPCSCPERSGSRWGEDGGCVKWSLEKKIILEMGQFSVNMLIILLGEGPLSALSTGRTREVFNHMWSTLFANSFDINKQNYAGWMKKGGEKGWVGKRRSAGKPCQHLPPCCRAGFGWGALIHIPWHSLAVVGPPAPHPLPVGSRTEQDSNSQHIKSF